MFCVRARLRTLVVTLAFLSLAVAPQPQATASSEAAYPTALRQSWGADLLAPSEARYSGAGVRVAIIDTGVDVNHPALHGHIEAGTSAVAYTGSYDDDNGHGTHIAGVVARLAPAADIYAIKVLDAKAKGSSDDIARGIDWAVANGCDVINLSLSTTGYSAAIEAACKRATDAGVVLVAATGNSGPVDGTVRYPSKFPGVIGVAATDRAERAYRKSSRGTEVDLAAPGVSIYSTWRGSRYRSMTGTSMAAAHVTGVIAQLLSQPPAAANDTDRDSHWSPLEVQERLQHNAKDLGAPGDDSTYGAGLITRLR